MRSAAIGSDPVRPAYGGASVSSAIPALMGDRSQDWLPVPVRDASSVVLLVLDGLGWAALRSHAQRMPVLARMEGAAITTVAPSTTSAALTSITTGRAPSEHGIVGFRVRAGDGVLNVLRWTIQGDGTPPHPAVLQPEAPFRGAAVPVVTRAEFASTPFSDAHLRGARFIGWRVTSSLVEHCRALVAAGERFVYAYYDGVDVVAHAYGLASSFYEAELASADRIVGELLDALPPDAALVVTADHGQVDLAPDAWVPLGAAGELVKIQAGDARFRYLHAVPGADADLLAAAEERFGGIAWVFSRERLLDEGWLGPAPRRDVRARVGDVVLCAREPIGFVDPANSYETLLRSGHGSLTADEMLVPLLAARGRG